MATFYAEVFKRSTLCFLPSSVFYVLPQLNMFVEWSTKTSCFYKSASTSQTMDSCRSHRRSISDRLQVTHLHPYPSVPTSVFTCTNFHLFLHSNYSFHLSFYIQKWTLRRRAYYDSGTKAKTYYLT